MGGPHLGSLGALHFLGIWLSVLRKFGDTVPLRKSHVGVSSQTLRAQACVCPAAVSQLFYPEAQGAPPTFAFGNTPRTPAPTSSCS